MYNTVSVEPNVKFTDCPSSPLIAPSKSNTMFADEVPSPMNISPLSLDKKTLPLTLSKIKLPKPSNETLPPLVASLPVN